MPLVPLSLRKSLLLCILVMTVTDDPADDSTVDESLLVTTPAVDRVAVALRLQGVRGTKADEVLSRASSEMLL